MGEALWLQDANAPVPKGRLQVLCENGTRLPQRFLVFSGSNVRLPSDTRVHNSQIRTYAIEGFELFNEPFLRGVLDERFVDQWFAGDYLAAGSALLSAIHATRKVLGLEAVPDLWQACSDIEWVTPGGFLRTWAIPLFENMMLRRKAICREAWGWQDERDAAELARELYYSGMPTIGHLIEEWCQVDLKVDPCILRQIARVLPKQRWPGSRLRVDVLLLPITRWPERKIVGVMRLPLRPDGVPYTFNAVPAGAGIPVGPDVIGDTLGGAVRLRPCSESVVLVDDLGCALVATLMCGASVWILPDRMEAAVLGLPPNVRTIMVVGERATSDHLLSVAVDEWRLEREVTIFDNPQYLPRCA
jgi:hypothetical protein